MTKTEYVVYYTDPITRFPHSHQVAELKEALRYTESFRQLGMLFVTMVSENVNSVGKSGVDTVADGKLPDGTSYDWNKNSRIGATKRR
jgi:hypothetical protein